MLRKRFIFKSTILIKRLTYSLLILSVLILVSFQNKESDKIDIYKFDEKKLEALIVKQLNSHRKKKRRTQLKLDPILAKAAKNQAVYLNKKNKLTHKQPSKNKRTALNRTDFFGGEFEYVGENVAYTYLNKSVNSAQHKNKVEIITTYGQLANHFYWLWKKSKPHYKNMIDKNFELTSIRFSFDNKRSKIYGVQVFGKK